MFSVDIAGDEIAQLRKEIITLKKENDKLSALKVENDNLKAAIAALNSKSDSCYVFL
jgi:cell division protein FtsB